MHNFLACAIVSHDDPHFHLADTAHSATRSRRTDHCVTMRSCVSTSTSGMARLHWSVCIGLPYKLTRANT